MAEIIAILIFVLFAFQAITNATDKGINFTDDLKFTEEQNYTSYNHERIDTIKETEKGEVGGFFDHLWLISGTITSINNDNEIITITIDDESDYSHYLMPEIFLDGHRILDQIDTLSINQKVDIKFLPNPNNEIIEPFELKVI